MPKLPNLRSRAWGVAAALLVTGLGLPAAADPGDELEKVRDRKAQVSAERTDKLARASDLSARLAELDRKRDRAEARVDELSAEVAAIDADIAAT
ncbi:MAG: hypothetical protein M3271_09545, partial [Actinomycetota bacterium]|nr:hypothetical protein [Actinomycetota bacterium]